MGILLPQPGLKPLTSADTWQDRVGEAHIRQSDPVLCPEHPSPAAVPSPRSHSAPRSLQAAGAPRAKLPAQNPPFPAYNRPGFSYLGGKRRNLLAAAGCHQRRCCIGAGQGQSRRAGGSAQPGPPLLPDTDPDWGGGQRTPGSLLSSVSPRSGSQPGALG